MSFRESSPEPYPYSATPLYPVLRGEGSGVRDLKKTSGFGVSIRLLALTPKTTFLEYWGESLLGSPLNRSDSARRDSGVCE